MAESNGSLKAANGHGLSKMNGKPARGRTMKTKQRRSYSGWIFSVAARLTIWAAIFSVLFRCPSSLDACDESSPYICKPYFQAKEMMFPHVQPYYDQYAAPYVEAAKPYYATVDGKVLTPARAYAVQYGAPWVEKGQQQVIAQWQKNGQPQVARLAALAQTRYDESVAPHLGKVSDAVGPYYEIARTNGLQLYYEQILPGYEFVQPYAMQGYDTISDFTTLTVIPTAVWSWNKTYVFVDTTVWPQLRTVYVENVEPQLVRIGERLGRYKTTSQTKSILEEAQISVEAATAKSSFSKPTPQSPTSVSSTVAKPDTAADTTSLQKDAEESRKPVSPPPPVENESDKRQKARDMVSEDLEMWQKKFAAQADEGAAEIEERINEIAKSMIDSDAKTTGKGLVDNLESTVDSELASLKLKISSLVENSAKPAEEIENDVVSEMRSVGVQIRDKAQTLRDWRKTYDAELKSTVLASADVHFNILDETRSLALQQIGMKWAWTDGVTHKDWAKYRELKSTLSEWTEQLKDAIVTYPALLEAQDASAQVEDEGMEIASAAAYELARLKEVAHYKILAQDATDNFETEAMKLAAEAALKVKQAERAAAESAAAVSTASETLSDATSAVKDAVSDATEAVEGQSTAASQSVSSILSSGADATNQAGELFDEAASTISKEEGNVMSGASSFASEAQATLASVADEISSLVAGSYTSASQSASEALSEASESLTESASSAATAATEDQEAAKSKLASMVSGTIVGDTQTMVANMTEVPPVVVGENPPFGEEPVDDEADEYYAEKPEAATVTPALFGAAAQAVSDRKPILEDYVDTDMAASATSAAEGAYANAVSMASEQYSSAVSVVSAQIYGTAKPVHEQLFASVSSVYDNAVAQASSRLQDAAEAASKGVYGTPTVTAAPTLMDWAKVESIASQRLNEGRLWAEVQYQSAMIAVGLATPTPTAPADKFYEQAKHNYYAGVGMAQERYSSFMAAASSAFSSITATPTPTDWAGSASSVASVARESAASAIHAAGEAAESVYSAATDSVVNAAEAVEGSIAGAADAAAEQLYVAGAAMANTWDDVIAEISGQVYGEPTAIGWYDNMMSGAGAQATAASDALSEGVSSATHAAADSAMTASAEAAKQYDAVSELVSELLSGKEPTFTESVLSRLGVVYATASANVENFASDASAAAASIGEKVGSAAGQATQAVKDNVQHARDEL